jgi:hypothetical protein
MAYNTHHTSSVRWRTGLHDSRAAFAFSSSIFPVVIIGCHASDEIVVERNTAECYPYTRKSCQWTADGEWTR